MGLFTRWYNDPRLQDVRYLASFTAPGGWYSPQWLSITCLRRLAHLIAKMESRPCYGWSCSASKWYLQNLDKVPYVKEVKPIVDDLAKRLRLAIHAYETETLRTWDADMFGKQVALVYEDAKPVLYGTASMVEELSGFGPPAGTPAGHLSKIISRYCWPSSSWGR